MERFKIGELLGKSSRILSNRLTKELGKNNIELTPEQWMILHLLVESPKSQKELCETTLKNKGSINSLVSNLTKADLVTKTTSATDRRNNVIAITPLGSQIKEESNEVASYTLDIALDGFTENEIDALTNYLSRIKNNLLNESN